MRLLLIVAALVIAPGSAGSAVLSVPDEHPTIAAALAHAAPGDSVVLADGTYVEHSLSLPPGITLRARSGATVVLDADNAGRHFEVQAGEPGSVIESIRFRQGVTIDRDRRDGGSLLLAPDASLTVRDSSFEDMLSSHFGGAIAVGTGASLTLERCVFERTRATLNVGQGKAARKRLSRASTAHGGAVYVHRRARLVARDCRFTDCHAKDSGGAVFVDVDAHAAFSDCVFRAGTSLTGGGIGASRANIELVGCEFTGNVTTRSFRSPAKGGAFDLVGDGQATVAGCSFTNNQASQGGAISLNRAENAEIRSSWFSGNAADAGGAVMVVETPTRIEDAAFLRNTAEKGTGGGVQVVKAAIELDHCSFHANSSRGGGSAVRVLALASAKLDHCLVTGGIGPDPIVAAPDHQIQLSCCVLRGNEGGDWTGALAAMADRNGNSSLDPRFREKDTGDLTLSKDSPCLDAPGCGRIGATGTNPAARRTGATP